MSVSFLSSSPIGECEERGVCSGIFRGDDGCTEASVSEVTSCCRPSAPDASCSQFRAKLSKALRSPSEGAFSAFSMQICAYRRNSDITHLPTSPVRRQSTPLAGTSPATQLLQRKCPDVGLGSRNRRDNLSCTARPVWQPRQADSYRPQSNSPSASRLAAGETKGSLL